MPEMLIRSKLKRPKAPISMPNGEGKSPTTYYFKPRDPNDPDSDHVAIVKDPKHIAKLLSISHCYDIAPDEDEGEDVTKPNVPASVAGDAGTDVPAPTGKQVAAVADTINADTVNSTLALKLPEFKKAIVGFGKSALLATLEAEKAKGEDDERPTFIKALEDQIAKAN